MKVRQFAKVYQDGEQEIIWVDKKTGGDVTVVKIEYHQPAGEGDAHYVDVHFSNGGIRRVLDLIVLILWRARMSDAVILVVANSAICILIVIYISFILRRKR